MNYLVIVLKYENQQNEVVKLNVFALIISLKKKKKGMELWQWHCHNCQKKFLEPPLNRVDGINDV